MEHTGLYRLAGLLVATLLVVAGAGYLMSADRGDGPSPAPASAVAAAAGEARPGEAMAGSPVCEVAGEPRSLSGEIEESSGVAASRRHAGIVWTHNDSGDPFLHALDADGRVAGRVRVTGAEIRDWEDVALAPCPAGGDCLYVGDIGDNDANRESVTVYRVPEPAPGDATTAPAAALRLRYPDGPHDAEALFVSGGSVYVITKGETGSVALYRAPVDAAEGTELERVHTISEGAVERPRRVTGADASADGRWIAVRTLGEVALHPAAAFLAGGAPPAATVDLEALEEPQGEAVAFAPDGGIVLTSEAGGKNEPATLSRLACTWP